MVSEVTCSNSWIIYMMKNSFEDELLNPLSIAFPILF
jgi:hypothetical protein